MITDIQLKNAKPKETDYTLAVDTGLTLLIKATGSKLWRFRYSYAKKRCMVSLGKYPQVTLKQAKLKVLEYSQLIDEGINPSTYKQTKKVQQTQEKSFRDVAVEWHSKHYQHSNDRHNKLVLRRLEKYVFPLIGTLPIKSLESSMLYNIMESIQEKGYIETGRRVNGSCSMVFRFGVAKGYCTRDLTSDYKSMLKTAKSTHMPTLTERSDINELLTDIQNYNGKIITKTALQISPYIFVRPSELSNSKWEFIDFEKSHWLIPARYMKMKRDHLIPIASHVEVLLKGLYQITGNGEYIFPNEKDNTKPMHSETVNKALRRIENGKYIGRMVSHGFRAMASTILNENKFRSDVIERQLAHQEGNKVRQAYNHAEYLEERTEMMQWYADYLSALIR